MFLETQLEAELTSVELQEQWVHGCDKKGKLSTAASLQKPYSSTWWQQTLRFQFP